VELREQVDKLGYGEPIIQRYGKPNEISIRMKLPEGADSDAALSDKMARTITADIKKNHPDARIDGVDSVSGKVSKELGLGCVQGARFCCAGCCGLYLDQV
jgi:preprotein translocase subunit SecF